MEERSSGFVIYCLKEGEPLYLLLRNSRDGYWGLPKGKVDPGESDRQAARRELAEETGITDFERREGFEHTITYRYSRPGKRVDKTVRYFLARVGSRDVKISREHCEFGWFTFQEAKEKIAFANLRGVVEKAQQSVRQE